MMKLLPLAAILSIVLFSCDIGPSLDRPAHEVTGPGFRIIHLGENRASSFSVELKLDSPSDVFVVFTNPTGSSQGLPSLSVSPDAAFTALSLSESGDNTRVVDSSNAARLAASASGDPDGDSSAGRVHAGNARRGVPGLWDVEPAWFEDPGEATETDATTGPDSAVRSSGVEGSGYEVGETEKLWRLSRQPSGDLSFDDFADVHATVGYVSESLSGFSLVIWVEDTLWNGGSGDIDSAMAEALGDTLTDQDTGPSVFQTLVDIFGSPWGNTAVSGVLPEDTQTVHVFLANILDAGSSFLDPDGSSTAGFVAGYFFNRDVSATGSLLSDDAPPSNEKLMVYVHGPAFATGFNPWSLTDPWPSEMALTTAHELQHLINYYQATVRTGRQSRTEVWLDELMSVLTEELVAERFWMHSVDRGYPNADESFLGPRGVPPHVQLPGTTVENLGRLVDFVAFPDRALTTWGGAVQYDYAASYAFGTWLVRNFGGVGLLPRIYESTSPGTRAVEDAVRWHTGESLTFGELLERWAAANVLSDRNIPARSYRLTASTWFESRPGANGTSGSGGIRLGDIPFSRYQQAGNGGGETGLFTFPPNDSTIVSQLHGSTHAQHSNIYFQAAAGYTGTINLDITGARAGRTTIIILEDQ